MSQIISSVFPSCTTSPLTRVSIALVVEVPVRDQPGPERAQRVRALDAQHRPGVGVAEVVQPVVVRRPCSPRMWSPASSGAMWRRARPITIAISPS